MYYTLLFSLPIHLFHFVFQKDVTNQISGYNYIFDMAGLSLSHLAQFTPSFAGRALSMLEVVTHSFSH